MSERKPIQISTTFVQNGYSTQCNYITTALCDDGSIWELRDVGPEDNGWIRLPEIPKELIE